MLVWRARSRTAAATIGSPASIGVDSCTIVSSGSASSALSVNRAACTAPSAAVTSFCAVASASSACSTSSRGASPRSKRELGGVARALRQVAQLDEGLPLRAGDVQPEVGAAHVVADLRHRGGQFGVAGAERRLADRDRAGPACRRARAAPPHRTTGFGVSFSNSIASSGFRCSPATASRAASIGRRSRAAAIVGLTGNARSIAACSVSGSAAAV